jgi:hypothetical protein
MSAHIRDSTFGVLLNYFSNHRLFPQLEDKPDFQIPERFLVSTSNLNASQTTRPSKSKNLSRTTTLRSAAGDREDDKKSLNQEIEDDKKSLKREFEDDKKSPSRRFDDDDKRELRDEIEEERRAEIDGQKVRSMNPADIEKAIAGVDEPEKHVKDSTVSKNNLVEWYSDDDPENPQ